MKKESKATLGQWRNKTTYQKNPVHLVNPDNRVQTKKTKLSQNGQKSKTSTNRNPQKHPVIAGQDPQSLDYVRYTLSNRQIQHAKSTSLKF